MADGPTPRHPFLASFGFAAKGIAVTFQGRNFRVQLAVGVVAIVLGVALHLEPVEWLAVIICIGLVLATECINTAIEALCDAVSPDFHPLIGRAKDCAAGAALVVSLASFAVGCLLFVPKLWALLMSL